MCSLLKTLQIRILLGKSVHLRYNLTPYDQYLVFVPLWLLPCQNNRKNPAPAILMTPRPGRTMVVGMEMCSYGERLLRLNLFSFQGRLLRNDIIMIWKIIKGLCSIPAAKLFSFYSTGNITIGHQYKMFLPHGNSEISSHFLSVHVISRWNFLSADTIPAENLDRLKARLHRDLGDEFFSYYH